MTNIAAAIGLAQLEDVVERKLAARCDLAARYRALLDDRPDIHLPSSPPWSESVNWLYTVRIDVPSDRDRDDVIARMADDGIETRPVFYPMHQLPPYFEPGGAYPVVDRLARTGVSLPTHLKLDDVDVKRVCESLTRHVTDVRRAAVRTSPKRR